MPQLWPLFELYTCTHSADNQYFSLLPHGSATLACVMNDHYERKEEVNNRMDWFEGRGIAFNLMQLQEWSAPNHICLVCLVVW